VLWARETMPGAADDAVLARARELGFRTFLGCMEETSVGIAASAAVASLAEWIDLDGCLILADDPVEQVRDVVRFFGLAGRTAPFSRCLRCNAPLLGVEKAQVLHLLQERTARLFERFSRCPSCGRTYWAGSHHERMLELVDRLTRP